MKNFQSDHGLDVDGSVGPQTWAGLNSAWSAYQTANQIRTDALRRASMYVKDNSVTVPPNNSTPLPTEQYMAQVYCPGAEYTTTRQRLEKSLTDLLDYQVNYSENPELYHLRANDIRDYLSENIDDTFVTEYLHNNDILWDIMANRQGSSAEDTRIVLEEVRNLNREEWTGSAHLMDMEILWTAVFATSTISVIRGAGRIINSDTQANSYHNSNGSTYTDSISPGTPSTSGSVNGGLTTPYYNGTEFTEWHYPDGTINPPPYNGAIHGTEQVIKFQPGQRFGRYGEIRPTSNFVTEVGADPGSLSFPPFTDPAIYQEFEVLVPIPNVTQSTVAPWGGAPGYGLQWQLPYPIEDLLNMRWIRTVD